MAGRRGRPLSRAEAARVVRGLVGAFAENRLLTHASEIAFQVTTALVPLAFLAVALLGFLDLSDLWRDDLAPRVQEELSPAAFAVVDSTLEQVLGSKRALWLTLGAVLTCWEVSSVVRAIMGTLNDVHGERENRPAARRYLVSLALSLAVLACVLGAVLSVTLAGRLVDVSGALRVLLVAGQWTAAVALLALALALLLRFAPARPRPLRWVSAGVAVVLGLWIGSSLVFGWYATSVASYGSLFGNLASVFVLLAYLSVASIAFVLGVQLDTVLESEVRGPSGRGTGRA